jgi:hypothetical protein
MRAFFGHEKSALSQEVEIVGGAILESVVLVTGSVLGVSSCYAKVVKSM